MTEPSTSPSARRRRGTAGITLGDVARLAGVSPITASRALNTPQQVAAETLAKVREAVMGETPARRATSLSVMPAVPRRRRADGDVGGVLTDAF